LPHFLRDVFSDSTLISTIGKERIALNPLKIKPGDYLSFEKIDKDKEREMPLVYLSHKTSDQDSNVFCEVDIYNLAIALAGNALVIYADDEDVSSEARSVGDIKYECYAGAMRVYMPHPNPDDESDGVRHRRLLFSFLRELGTNQAILYKAFSQDFYYNEANQLIRIEYCVVLNKEASTVSHIIELIEDFSKKR
jgi:hypothetical protein